jgi:hypothetical protein
MRNGDFSNPSLLPIFDPDTIRQDPANPTRFIADAFPNRQIPQARFKQPFVKMLEFYPLPNLPGAVVAKDPNNFVRNSPNPVDWSQFTTRIDFAEGSNSQWFGRYSWGDEKILNGGAFEINDRRIVTMVDQIMLSNTRTFSPTLVNELRLGANIFDNSLETFYNGIRDVTSELGVPGLLPPAEAAWGTPSIGFTDRGSVAGWGEATEAPFINHSRTYQITDNMSWVHGNHTIRFGGEITDRRYNLIGNQFPRGFFQFGGRATAMPGAVASTGDSFASGLLGWITEAPPARWAFRACSSGSGPRMRTWKIPGRSVPG